LGRGGNGIGHVAAALALCAGDDPDDGYGEPSVIAGSYLMGLREVLALYCLRRLVSAVLVLTARGGVGRVRVSPPPQPASC